MCFKQSDPADHLTDESFLPDRWIDKTICTLCTEIGLVCKVWKKAGFWTFLSSFNSQAKKRMLKEKQSREAEGGKDCFACSVQFSQLSWLFNRYENICLQTWSDMTYFIWSILTPLDPTGRCWVGGKYSNSSSNSYSSFQVSTASTDTQTLSGALTA